MTNVPAHDQMDGRNFEAERLKRVARFIEDQFGGRGSVGFLVIVFPLNAPPEKTVGNYISNANRDDIIDVLEKRVARLKQTRVEPKAGHA